MHILIKRIFFSPHADGQKAVFTWKKAVSRGWEWPEAKPENEKSVPQHNYIVLQGVV